MVSIIVPNYNHAAFLPKRISSILGQSYQDFELIIFDDASTDNSVDILNSFLHNPEISHFIKNDQNTGSPYVQWERGIQLAKGEYIWIAETDDFSDPAFLSVCIEKLEKNSSIGMAFCKSSLVDQDEHPIQSGIDFQEPLDNARQENFEGISFINQFLVKGCIILNVSSVLFRKKAFDRFNHTFSQLRTFKYYGDWYIYVTIALTWGVEYLPDRLNYFRRTLGAFSNTQTSLLHLREKLAIQNYIVANTNHVANYNVVVDHIYFEAYCLLTRANSNTFSKLLSAWFFVKHDRFGFRRLLTFIFTMFKNKFLSRSENLPA